MTLGKARATNAPIGFSLSQFRDLAPSIHRQRLVIEGYPKAPITDDDIKQFLSQLSTKLDMKELIEPVTHRSETYGWAGWIHWETSGAHFYAWEQPLLFFSVDIYTCKPFDPQVAVDFTGDYFSASQIAARGS
ncbi:S-adenosylmethionine decarboxylase [Mycolicibacterium sphagni]|uniref:S-adenosylmethionine decarboxylase n=1 Tax=Mycolicibacterium sphagni TaxID=1786 RepID=UPI001F180E9E|nr:S-adenosylmethionine decarboxylase [Mycolicibacterium sphagni]